MDFFLKGSTLKYLAGPLAKGKYAQAANEELLSIGEVSNVNGEVKATKLTEQQLIYQMVIRFFKVIR